MKKPHWGRERQCWCGRWVKSLGWASHRAAHYRKREKPPKRGPGRAE